MALKLAVANVAPSLHAKCTFCAWRDASKLIFEAVNIIDYCRIYTAVVHKSNNICE